MKHHRLRPFPMRSAFTGLVLLGVISCASKSAPPSAEAPTPPAGAEGSKTPPAEPSAAAPDTPVSAPAASGSAAESEEIPKNCNFRVKGFCFADQDEACAASDCPPGKCMVLESHPARIKCAK
jgi:hypothetical protein